MPFGKTFLGEKMKPILLVRTGGTICTVFDGEKRTLNAEKSKLALISSFANSDSKYANLADRIFVDSDFPKEHQTLSENMTPTALDRIARHLLSIDQSAYSGIIILHGTDTLAFTANLLSFLFPNISCPVMLVSGNHPPLNPRSNAPENFRFAVEGILDGAKNHITVPYCNSDGTFQFHSACKLLQCKNFTDNFDSVESLEMQRPTDLNFPTYHARNIPANSLLLFSPYPCLSYERLNLDGIKAVVHGTYHSETLCAQGESPYNIGTLIQKCTEKGIPLYIAPSELAAERYESMTKLGRINFTPLPMSTESAWGKALAGLTFGLEGEDLTHYMKTEIIGEFLKLHSH